MIKNFALWTPAKQILKHQHAKLSQIGELFCVTNIALIF